jgi:acyl carrier protein phosphodiesterase
MNFLAHLYLSSHNHDLMIGNFIADAVKGKKYLDYPDAISKGIMMHRFIDHYTDTHANVLECTKILRPYIGKFSPVALDVFFDHLLAKNWQLHHPEKLELFTTNTYEILWNNTLKMPEQSQYILKYMSAQNWLLNYAHIDGIAKALNGMANRSKFGAILGGSERYLEQFEPEINQHFTIFFEAIKLELAQRNWLE